MFADLASSKISSEIVTDIAVVGSGPAGIALSRQLASFGRTVSLFESGDTDYSAAAQELNDGIDVRGRNNYLGSCRIRAFGGTSFHWGGWCRPLDRIDFQKRDWIAHSGWPIDHDTLAAHYSAACRICDLDADTFDLASWSGRRAQSAFPLPPERFVSSYFQLSKPTRFGEKFRDELAKSERIKVYVNATVRSIELHPDGRSCDRLILMHPDGSQVPVRARRFVIACGGIENARLLLLSNSVMAAGIGNDRDLVGRYFMDHPAFTSGRLAATDGDLQVGLYEHESAQRVRGFATLVPSDELCAALQIPRFNVELLPELDSTRKNLGKLKGSYWSIADSIKKGNFVDEIQPNLSRFMSIITDGSKYAIGEILHSKPKVGQADLRNHLETSPNPDSRVTLDRDGKDRFGLAQARLDWRVAPADFRGWTRGLRRLAEDIGAAGIGRVKLEQDEMSDFNALDYETSYHQIGTTRMHDTAAAGVVDRDCRVHGLDNLYIAGSSVFPTCGHANPTLTIVALSLRLADHLRERG